MLSGFEEEWLQKCCDALDSFTWPYGVCWDAWNGLKWSRTSTGVAAAYASKLKSGFVILRFLKCEECLDSSSMLYMMCLQHWFGLKHFSFENSIVTCSWSKIWRKERNVWKAWTKDALVWFDLVYGPLFIGQGLSTMWAIEILRI